MTMYRKVVWYLKGKSEYTKPGYLAAANHFTASDLEVNCAGKSYMITGANSGIGKVTALELAKRGGTIHMVCRNLERGEQAKEEIIANSGNGNVRLHILDMSKPDDVYRFANQFCESEESLDVLINNAGCMVNQREVSELGYEANFATNTLGTYILTSQLIRIIQRSNNSRVIIVTSGGMLVQKLDVKDLQFEKMKPFDGTMAYAQNKRQQVVMTEKFAAIHPGIHFSTMHPGWADTPAVKASMPDFYAKMKDKLRTPYQGADTLIWLAASDAAQLQASGQFFQDRKPASTHLPLAITKSSAEEDDELMKMLKGMMERCI